MRDTRLLFFALGMLSVVSIGAVGIGDGGIEFPDGTVQTTAASPPLQDPRRAFYLTVATWDGRGADGPNVCAPGFHFASMWEIWDVSNLKYDTVRGQSCDDSGEGPPSCDGGWIRTGFGDRNAGAPGIANCSTWGSNSSEHLGSLAFLDFLWNFEGVLTWQSITDECSETRGVWCVEDFPGSGISRG